MHLADNQGKQNAQYRYYRQENKGNLTVDAEGNNHGNNEHNGPADR